MVGIERLTWTQKYENDVKKTKDKSIKNRLEKQIRKIISNPNFGKPLSYSLKGERTIYVKPYRLIFTVKRNTLLLLRFEHRGKVY